MGLLVGAVVVLLGGWYVVGWITTGAPPGVSPPPSAPPPPSLENTTDGPGGRGPAACGGAIAGGAASGAAAGAPGGPIGIAVGAIIGFAVGGVSSAGSGACGPTRDEVRAAGEATTARLIQERGCVPQRPCGAFRFLHPRDCEERDAINATCRPPVSS